MTMLTRNSYPHVHKSYPQSLLSMLILHAEANIKSIGWNMEPGAETVQVLDDLWFNKHAFTTIYGVGLDHPSAVKAWLQCLKSTASADSRSWSSCQASWLPYHCTLDSCIPWGLLIYLQMVYIPCHAGNVLPKCDCTAVPSTVAKRLSHLCMMLK